MSKTSVARPHVTTTAALFGAIIGKLLPETDDTQRKIISAYTEALTDKVDQRRRATSGKHAVGYETLSATAAVLFGAALAELGFNTDEIAEHGAQFGVQARSLVANT